ncbi:MAG TPA: squalene/phytoene synthase family protein [Mycobacteriales bacterium]|nr:squalene/phytoene synthase family protein [Mycobacteriales bacterium]
MSARSGLPLGSTLAQAYAHCEVVTRTEARNFSYGIRLLPADQRRALSAVYALARRIDDIGDGDLGAPDKFEHLDRVRKDVAALGEDSTDPVLVAVADVAAHFPIPVEAFAELVDGVEMDVRGTSYDTFDDLVVYCRRVAGTVGRLCFGIYGAASPAERPAAARLADDLGVALQQTNILRDIREDLQAGRVYVPASDLCAHGVTLGLDADGVLGGPPEALAALVVAGAARAERWYADGFRLLAYLDRRGRACTAAMAGIYVRLNRRLAADPLAVTRQRVSLPGREKALVAARALVGGAP